MADAIVTGAKTQISKKVELPVEGKPASTADGEALPEFPEGLDPFSGPRKGQTKARNPNTDIANSGTPDEPVKVMSRSVAAILNDVGTHIPTKPLRVTVETPPENDDPAKKQAKQFARVDW